MKPFLLIALCFSFILSGCKKEANCSTSIGLTSTSTTPSEGESFTITATQSSDDDLFQWSGPGHFSGIYDNTLTVDNPSYLARGWYYCSKSNPDCGEVAYDSIFIDMRLRQGTAPCTVTNNSIEGPIPTTNFYSVTKVFDASFNAKSLYASASLGYPNDFKVLFNSNNGNIEPIDGIYTTTNSPIFGQTDPYSWVSLSFVYGGQFYHSHPNKDVFVSHVNGKLSASFCNVPFSNGTYIINISGKLTEQ